MPHDIFAAMGKAEAEQLGMPEPPLLVIKHPLGGQPPAGVERRVEEVCLQLAAAIPMAAKPPSITPWLLNNDGWQLVLSECVFQAES
jgi:hypothetical protein